MNIHEVIARISYSIQAVIVPALIVWGCSYSYGKNCILGSPFLLSLAFGGFCSALVFAMITWLPDDGPKNGIRDKFPEQE